MFHVLEEHLQRGMVVLFRPSRRRQGEGSVYLTIFLPARRLGIYRIERKYDPPIRHVHRAHQVVETDNQREGGDRVQAEGSLALHASELVCDEVGHTEDSPAFLRAGEEVATPTLTHSSITPSSRRAVSGRSARTPEWAVRDIDRNNSRNWTGDTIWPDS